MFSLGNKRKKKDKKWDNLLRLFNKRENKIKEKKDIFFFILVVYIKE